MREVAIKGIMILRENPIEDVETQKLVMFKYFELCLNFCLNSEDEFAVINRFNELFVDFEPDFDILTMAKELSPMGFDQLIKKKEKKVKKGGDKEYDYSSQLND